MWAIAIQDAELAQGVDGQTFEGAVHTGETKQRLAARFRYFLDGPEGKVPS